MCPAFIKAAKTISTERLHDANVNVGVVVAQEGFAIEGDETAQRVKIMIEKLLAEVGWEIGLGVIQERGNVILQSAFAATLIVDEIRIAVAQKDVAGLKVAIEKIIARGAEKEFGEAAEVVFQSLFIEGDAGEAKKIVFEIVQVPGDGLAVETGDGIADLVIQIAASFDLKAR